MTARLGLGLIGIGRPWPADSSAVASQDQARELLATARRLGIGFLDTAPAYGGSEAVLGQILREQGDGIGSARVVATKCGEYWSPELGSWTDHRPASVEASVRQSLARLGRVDILQVHKATAEVLADPALLRVLGHLAAELEIAHLGVSVKDVAACSAALEAGIFGYLQCPVNQDAPELAAWAGAHASDITIIANRPYGSGQLLVGGQHPRALLSYVLDHIGDGVVLTGTTNPAHLRQTHEIFEGLTHD